MNRIIERTGWTLLGLVGLWAFVAAFAGLASWGTLTVAYLAALVAVGLIVLGHVLERGKP